MYLEIGIIAFCLSYIYLVFPSIQDLWWSFSPHLFWERDREPVTETVLSAIIPAFLFAAFWFVTIPGAMLLLLHPKKNEKYPNLQYDIRDNFSV